MLESGSGPALFGCACRLLTSRRFHGYARATLAELLPLCLGFCALARAAPTQHVVSLGGDITEIVYALGEQGRLACDDQTSIYPPEAAKLRQVGYLRTLSAEGVLSCQPDLILASEDAGPAAALSQLAGAGVPLVRSAMAIRWRLWLRRSPQSPRRWVSPNGAGRSRRRCAAQGDAAHAKIQGTEPTIHGPCFSWHKGRRVRWPRDATRPPMPSWLWLARITWRMASPATSPSPPRRP